MLFVVDLFDDFRNFLNHFLSLLCDFSTLQNFSNTNFPKKNK